MLTYSSSLKKKGKSLLKYIQRSNLLLYFFGWYYNHAPREVDMETIKNRICPSDAEISWVTAKEVSLTIQNCDHETLG